ncbi:MAG: hypothetical protein EXR99_10115 [Gemmataceae bacterium]|nr:hypothetical protein [Gemmataceae bacterium]
MRDPFSWSIPLGRLFGILIKIHFLFPLVILGLALRFGTANPPYLVGTWIDFLQLSGWLFLSVLLHELGHCWGARKMDGEAHEILLWPLGGLASLELPHRARAHFVTAAAGPAVNFILCLFCLAGLAILDKHFQPPWNPFWYPFRIDETAAIEITAWNGESYLTTNWGVIALARIFYVNWTLFLFNVLLIGYPLDGGQMLRAYLWPRLGYKQATLFVVYTGYFCMAAMALWGIMGNEILLLCLAVFLYVSCKSQALLLENPDEQGEFGYDFSHGYTSLERDLDEPEDAPVGKKTGWWESWKQARAIKRMQKEMARHEAEEKRMDGLLEKLHRDGKDALTEDENLFMRRFSKDRKRN